MTPCGDCITGAHELCAVPECDCPHEQEGR